MAEGARSAKAAEWNDQSIEVAIARLLRFGVTLSAVVVLAGGVLYLVQQHGERRDYAAFHGVKASLSQTLGGVFRGTMRGEGRSVIELGLLLLIATPVARVLIAVLGFLRERDWMYTVVSAAVLAILAYSLLFGK
jgi:uncharacterized membrane protein